MKKDYKTFNDLNREELISLKQRYLAELDNEGTLNKLLYGDAECEDGLSYGELANADKLVSDEILKERFGGTVFTEEDFI